MAFIGSLITTVRANTAPFVKGMKKAERRTRALRKSMKRLAGTFVKVGAAGIAVAGAALVAYTLKAFKAIDVTAKLASEMQIATEDLISFQVAAGLSGSSTEVVTKALQRMARTVGEARAGITTGTKALEDFGLNIKELQGLTTAEIFTEFSEKIKNIEDPMIQAAKASLIFGKAGQKLLNFLKLGKSGLAAVNAEAKALGLHLSVVDAKKVEDANDAIFKMQEVFDGVGRTIAIKVAPAITSITDKMLKFIKDSGGIKQIVENNLGSLAEKLELIGGAITAAGVAWDSFALGIGKSTEILTGGIGEMVSTFDKFKGLITGEKVKENIFQKISLMVEELNNKKLKQLNKGLKDLTENRLGKSLSEGMKELVTATDDVANSLNKLNTNMVILNKGPKELASGFAEAVKEMERLEAQQEKVIAAAKRIFEETRTPLESIEAEIKRINEIFNQGGFEGMESAFERKIKELKEAKKKIEDALKITGPTKEGIGKLVKSIVGDSVEAAFGLKKKKKEKEREAGFKQIDVRNINVKGLAKFGSTDQKILDEQVKAREVLNKIEQNTKSGSGAKAV